ncbi:MAG: DUF433 domain-containing protein [Tepidisphaerales bacterium]
MQATLDQYIQSSAGTRGGKPLIAGTRITVADVALMHLRLGQALEQVAAGYDLSMASLHAAMAFYYDHREEIDRSIEEDDAFIEAMRSQNPSRLQAKLRALNGG